MAAAPAHAAWSDPEDVSAAGQSAAQQVVGIDTSGNAVIAWTRSDGAQTRVQVRRRLADGTLTPIQTISQPNQNATGVRMAVAPNGDAVLVWQRYDGVNFRVQARRRTAAGTLGPILTVSGAGADAGGQDVGIDDSGDAVMVWSRAASSSLPAFATTNGASAAARVELRTLSAAGTLTSAQSLSPSGSDATNAKVAVDADGDSITTWQATTGGGQPRIQERTRSSAGTLGTMQSLSTAGSQALFPRVDMDPNGNALIAWILYDGTSYVAQARGVTPAGALSSSATLSATGFSDGNAQNVDVAMDSSGNGLVVWDRFNGFNNVAQGRYRMSNGSYRGVQEFSPTNEDATGPHAAFDSAGNAMVIWQGSVNGLQVRARQRIPSGSLGTIATLSPDGENAFSPLDVDRNPSGATIAGWVQNGVHLQIQVAAGP